MIRAVADTHAVVWYLYNDPRLSPKARTYFEDAAAAGDQIACSTITLVEIVYLIEKRRIDAATLTRLVAELDAENSVLMEVPLDRHIAQAMQQIEREDVPDMPDRIIAATALRLGLPLISRDGKIQLSDLTTIW